MDSTAAPNKHIQVEHSDWYFARLEDDTCVSIDDVDPTRLSRLHDHTGPWKTLQDVEHNLADNTGATPLPDSKVLGIIAANNIGDLHGHVVILAGHDYSIAKTNIQ